MDKLLATLNREPQSRDRRPRLSAPKSLLLCEIRPLMRTDEGVCLYFEVSFLIDEGTSLIQGNAFFDVKKRPLHSKETPPSNREGRSLVFSPAAPANEARLRYTLPRP